VAAGVVWHDSIFLQEMEPPSNPGRFRLKPTHHRTLTALGLDAYTPKALVTFLEPWLGLWL